MRRDAEVVRRYGILIFSFLLFAPLGFCKVARVTFPSIGTVKVYPIRIAGRAPAVNVVDTSGKVILRVVPATGKFWRVNNVSDVAGPHLWFTTLHVAGLPDPLLLVVSVYLYADGIGSRIALVGEENGKLAVLTPTMPQVGDRGGAYLEPENRDCPPILTLSIEKYVPGDTIAGGPSRMTFYQYVFQSAKGQFVLKGKLSNPAARTRGQNLLSLYPEDIKSSD